jgi:hypothetical protein
VRPAGAQRCGTDLVADELGVDAALTYAPGDQLRVLAAEVDDENGALLGSGLTKGNDLSLSAADSSATPS